MQKRVVRIAQLILYLWPHLKTGRPLRVSGYLPRMAFLGQFQNVEQRCHDDKIPYCSWPVVTHTFNPSTREPEADGSVEVRDQPTEVGLLKE